jgi:hypothetical protein
MERNYSGEMERVLYIDRGGGELGVGGRGPVAARYQRRRRSRVKRNEEERNAS